jgi:hypothetical protein
MQMMQELGEFPLRIPLRAFDREPLLHALLPTGSRNDLIADVENDVPAVLIAFADAASHVMLPSLSHG